MDSESIGWLCTNFMLKGSRTDYTPFAKWSALNASAESPRSLSSYRFLIAICASIIDRTRVGRHRFFL